MSKVKNNETKKDPYFRTKQKANGGIEVEMPKSPSKTITGKIFAILIAALTLLVPLIAVIVAVVTRANR